MRKWFSAELQQDGVQLLRRGRVQAGGAPPRQGGVLSRQQRRQQQNRQQLPSPLPVAPPLRQLAVAGRASGFGGTQVLSGGALQRAHARRDAELPLGEDDHTHAGSRSQQRTQGSGAARQRSRAGGSASG